MEICPFSGLPFTCALCPEDDAPCYEKTKLRTKDDKKLGYSFYVSDYLLGRNILKREDKSYNDYLKDYDKHPRSSFDLSHHLDPLTLEDFKVLNLCSKSHPFELPIVCFDNEVFNAK